MKKLEIRGNETRERRAGLCSPAAWRALRQAGQAATVVLGVVVFGLGWAIAESAVRAAGATDPQARKAMAHTFMVRARSRAIPEVDALPRVSLPRASVWLVDGYNTLNVVLLGGCDRSGWWKQGQRERLLERVRCFEGRAAEVWVVFDGGRPAEPSTDSADRVRVVFAPSADDWLLRRVRSEADPSRLAVVTADRQLADRARHKGAHAVAPSAFLAACPSEGHPRI